MAQTGAMTADASRSPLPRNVGTGTAAGAAPSRQLSRPAWIGLTLIVGLAGLLRLIGCGGDLALDEVWSLWFVEHVLKRLTEIFLLRHDNNHPFNTLIMYAIGPKADGVWYRIPAALASTAAVLVAAKIALRQTGIAAGLLTSALVGGSYLMILYGSEARGYSYAVLFAGVSWWSLLRLGANGRWQDAAVFAAAACLGFLSHLTFLYAYAGFCAWTLFQLRSPKLPLLLAAHFLPFGLTGWLYLYFIRGMATGGGPEDPLFGALLSTFSLAVGGPQHGDAALVAAALAAILLGAGLVAVHKRDQAEALAYVTIIGLAPAAVLFATGHTLVYPRYFLVPIAFALLVLGELLAAWWQSGRAGRIGAGVALTTVLAGNGWQTARLFDHGRGDYSAAVRWIAERSADGPATVGGDHDFRIGMLFDYYVSRSGPASERLKYVDQRNVPKEGTDWLILHDFAGDDPFPDTITGRNGRRYTLRRTFRHHSLTGYNWWAYQRADETAK